jgi:hypothetical protein
VRLVCPSGKASAPLDAATCPTGLRSPFHTNTPNPLRPSPLGDGVGSTGPKTSSRGSEGLVGLYAEILNPSFLVFWSRRSRRQLR